MNAEEFRLLSPKRLVETLNGAISLGLLRSQLFRRRQNGLLESGAVVVVSCRKILIDYDQYLQWLRSRSSAFEAGHE